jgi:hypothetical protein
VQRTPQRRLVEALGTGSAARAQAVRRVQDPAKGVLTTNAAVSSSGQVV